VNVSSSITPLIGERLTDIRPKLQWSDVDWKKVGKCVNRLQARITKAVRNRKGIRAKTECHGNKLLPDTERVMKCLSGMRGNFHVPF